MTAIERVTQLASPALPPRIATTGPAFLPAEPAPADSRPTEAAAAAPVAPASLLALQQVEAPEDRDRNARRRGQALLTALGRLQLGLLRDLDPAGGLAELDGLLHDIPLAADPAVAAAVAALVLRARVELARHAGR